MVKDSGGEAASFWSWAAQRRARGHAGSFPAATARNPPGRPGPARSAGGGGCIPRSRPRPNRFERGPAELAGSGRPADIPLSGIPAKILTRAYHLYAHPACQQAAGRYRLVQRHHRTSPIRPAQADPQRVLRSHSSRAPTSTTGQPLYNAVGAMSPRGHGRFRIGVPGAGDDLPFCGQLGRTGAPCQDCSWWVSPARPPHPACDSHRTGRSTCLARWVSWLPGPAGVPTGPVCCCRGSGSG